MPDGGLGDIFLVAATPTWDRTSHLEVCPHFHPADRPIAGSLSGISRAVFARIVRSATILPGTIAGDFRDDRSADSVQSEKAPVRCTRRSYRRFSSVRWSSPVSVHWISVRGVLEKRGDSESLGSRVADLHSAVGGLLFSCGPYFLRISLASVFRRTCRRPRKSSLLQAGTAAPTIFFARFVEA
jgi:hypothetical protein